MSGVGEGVGFWDCWHGLDVVSCRYSFSRASGMIERNENESGLIYEGVANKNESKKGVERDEMKTLMDDSWKASREDRAVCVWRRCEELLRPVSGACRFGCHLCDEDGGALVIVIVLIREPRPLVEMMVLWKRGQLGRGHP